MGWTHIRDYDGRDLCAYFDELYTNDDVEFRDEVLASSLMGRSRYYAAIRTTNKHTGEARIWARVTLFYHNPTVGFDRALSWKTMDEAQGPHAIDCPEAILDLLTDPPLNKFAATWRTRCRDHHTKTRIHSN